MDVEVVPCLKDNYAYLVRAPGAKAAAVIDASEAAPVLGAVERLGLELRAILATHHHADHVGGNLELLRRFPELEVFGSARDRGRIPGQTRFVEDGERLAVVGLEFLCLLIPGHTLGAVAYVGHGAAFTGDTLFAAGCGRLFEGTPGMMHASLNEKLLGLPEETRVYCGHEYTAKNLEFAATVEPSNATVREKLAAVRALRARGEPTVPSTLAEERLTNPFLRCASPEIIATLAERASASDPVSVFAALRSAKDVF